MTNVVEFKRLDLTPSEKERVERLVWTENAGRGWKAKPVAPSEMPLLLVANDELESRQVPAARAAVIALLARLANLYPKERAADDWKMLFEDYADELNGISEAHLREVLSTARREKPWFPQIADLMTMWTARKYRDAERLRRTRVLLGEEQAKPWERADDLPPEAKSESTTGAHRVPGVGQPQTAAESLRPSHGPSNGVPGPA